MLDFIYSVGKLVGLLTAPAHFVILLLLISVFFLRSTHANVRRWGRGLVTLITLLAIFIMLVPVGRWGMAFLENRFPQPKFPEHIAGIIVLGGGEREEVAATRSVTLTANGTMGRLLNFRVLADKYPDAMLVYTGGSSQEGNGSNLRQADIAKGTLEAMGLARKVHYENESRTTYENALYSSKIVGEKRKEPWILVTSAWHIPRSMGTFRKQGWNVIAMPVDYVTRVDEVNDNLFRFNFSGNLSALSGFLRETIGMMGYYYTDRSSELFPKP